jgi:riboflavin kinase/FMN adenylyltransferase
MQVITNLDLFVKPKSVILTQGTFDGVHSGHKQILSNIVALAKEKQGKSVLLTFHPHPRQVLFNDVNTIKLLTTQEEKIELFSDIGIDYLIIIPFDEALSKMSGVNFVRDILVEKIGVTTMVVGYDHRFGKNREASFEDLKEFGELYGFEVKEIAAHDVKEATVSSTKIRNSLLCGDIEYANLFLDRPYSITGTVVHGKKLGKGLGYPTANIELNESDKLIPQNGVYAVNIIYENKKFNGMLNIGNNPTVPNAKWSIEVNIFNFDKSIYGEKITILFVGRMRDELKFNTMDDLKTQLHLDKKLAEQILK